ncbi:MAG: hypothetical protein JW708_07410 [Vallitaleaceae bacterium]|nr:hypothetical protein [Vallitaleaceae bacterium]
MNRACSIEKLIFERNQTGGGNETIEEEVRARKEMEEFVKQCRLELPEEVAELFESYTRLIWQYQCPGMIYKFYCDQTIWHGENGKSSVGVEGVLANTLALLRAFPDRKVHFVDIFVEGSPECGYSFGQATRFLGKNTGLSPYGKPTGKSLSEDGKWCHSICELRIEKRENRWRVVEEWVVDSQETIEETMKFKEQPKLADELINEEIVTCSQIE